MRGHTNSPDSVRDCGATGELWRRCGRLFNGFILCEKIVRIYEAYRGEMGFLLYIIDGLHIIEFLLHNFLSVKHGFEPG